MPWIGRMIVSTAGSTGRPVTGASCGAAIVEELFDMVRLEPGFTDGCEIGVGCLLVGVQTGCTDPHLVHLRSRHLVERTGNALHAGSAMHAVDQEGHLFHYTPTPYAYRMRDRGQGCK